MKTIAKPSSFSRTWLKDILPPDAHILEAGTHSGNDTQKLARMFSAGMIYGFEPTPETFALAQENCKSYPNIKLYNSGLGNYEGTHTLFVTPGRMSTTNSFFKPDHTHHDSEYQTISVPITTVDAWMHNHAIRRLDFMWLDAQGGELAILQGALQALPQLHAILVEVNTVERYEGIPLYNHIKDFLESHGFKLLLEHLHHTTWGNALFYNPAFLVIQ